MSLNVRVQQLEQELLLLRGEVLRLNAVNAITNLHYKYGYYYECSLFEAVVELFSSDCVLVYQNGVWRGRAGVRRLYCDWLRPLLSGGRDGPKFGVLADHAMMQPIVDVDPDGGSAKGRFRCFIQAGAHVSRDAISGDRPRQFWESGIYENAYVKEDGVWKIQMQNYNQVWRAAYDDGWARTDGIPDSFALAFPEDPEGPDELLAEVPTVWPEPRVIPFHYPHPTTGEPWGDPEAFERSPR